MKFFDRKTNTLFITSGKTNVADLSDNQLIQVFEPQAEEPSFYKLRRQNAGLLGNHFEKHFISNSTCQEYVGNYDLSHSSNTDLEEVQTIICCP
ncbi:hypothetical protein [Legionella cincinnatiensis]|uniref:Uncharacterized protein n=1 Tax=Legionella cincinnatiensis TaxID=28085 RepID=A0A378IM50_9GAMM|nr:hypothetical protein [Legionella cincinnatiensis]KTC83154.1 hypothetical protein Lcin_2526 [Legionella cincinnatiensis]STX35715.1 Uncharacterised protein [Legionella cincinnatiensis]